MTSLPKTTAILLLLLSASFASASDKTHTVSGRIVAKTNGLVSLLCLNGNGYYSVIIELAKPHKEKPQFVEMHFSQTCGEKPDWLLAKSEFKTFRLIPDDPRQILVKEFVPEIQKEGSTNALRPAWTTLPGAEDVKLPFGEKIPSYRCLDLPYASLL